MTLLRIDSSARRSSVSRPLMAKFVEPWKKQNPAGEVIERDLSTTCDYKLSIAFALGRREGGTEEELAAARRAEANDPKTAAALRFAAKTVRERGRVSSSDLDELHNAGFSDEEIVEIIGLIAPNIFRNYFNLIAGTEVDFPLVRAKRAA